MSNTIIKLLFLVVTTLSFPKMVFNQNIYFGDLHLHSELSGDANGNIDSLYKFASQVSKIDFVCFSEHNPSNITWETMKQKANLYYIPNNFVTFCGYEWTSVNNGHRIVFYPNGNPPVFVPNLFALDTLMKLLFINNGLAIIAHSDFYPYQSNPATTIKDSKVQNNIEIQGYQNYRYEYYNNPNPPPNQLQNHSVQDWLVFNEPLGFVANSDDHTGNPGMRGLTAIISNSLTRDSLFQSLKRRHNYATSGARIKLHFSCSKGIMGDSITCTDNETINFIVTSQGTNKISKIEILKNNLVINTIYANDSIVNYNFPVQFQAPKNNIYVRVYQIDNHMAWSSPIFVYKEAVTSTLNESKSDLQNYFQIFPNPTNNYTVITYSLVQDGNVDINLFDVLGKKVAEIFKGKQNKGNHKININISQLGLNSGIYYCQIQSISTRNTIRLIINK